MAKVVREPRRIRVGVGDTLRALAARELGDAGRWVEVASLNGLRPPYIVASVNPADRLPYTLIYGDWLRLPVAATARRTRVYAEDLFGIDMRLESDGSLGIENGDFAVIAGRPNLGQALRLRLKTPLGELLMHHGYGCNVSQVLGMKLIPVVELLARGFIARALGAEPRVQQVIRLVTAARGDVLAVNTAVVGVSENTPVDLNLAYPLER